MHNILQDVLGKVALLSRTHKSRCRTIGLALLLFIGRRVLQDSRRELQSPVGQLLVASFGELAWLTTLK